MAKKSQPLRVWDAQTGELLMILVSVAQGETASLDPVNNSFLWASPGAWRHLGWRIFDPLFNRTRILPAEFRGPLPG